ncbi:MAG TPA: hypothetical protein DCY72_03130 [Ruminococcaceae bacterium]|nr:hypothetical protein [Oscillospiraceae bacterium]
MNLLCQWVKYESSVTVLCQSSCGYCKTALHSI